MKVFGKSQSFGTVFRDAICVVHRFCMYAENPGHFLQYFRDKIHVSRYALIMGAGGTTTDGGAPREIIPKD
eukprot:COSAG05_NODE_74_length_21769_cov_194.316290_16_plen_71_part_00